MQLFFPGFTRQRVATEAPPWAKWFRMQWRKFYKNTNRLMNTFPVSLKTRQLQPSICPEYSLFNLITSCLPRYFKPTRKQQTLVKSPDYPTDTVEQTAREFSYWPPGQNRVLQQVGVHTGPSSRSCPPCSVENDWKGLGSKNCFGCFVCGFVMKMKGSNKS